jgi:CRP-like cAMP-binding protein
MLHALDSTNYQSTVRASHDLAGVLKRTRPQFREEIDELQGIVTRAQQQLANTRVHGEAIAAWNDLEAAYQALQHIKHHHNQPTNTGHFDHAERIKRESLMAMR